MSPDISVIIVSFNTRELLRRCLGSLLVSEDWHPEDFCLRHARRPMVVEVIVVDNGSDDESPLLIPREFPWVRLLTNSENLGFARANNQGTAVSSGRYLLLLNPDTETAGEALSNLLDFAEKHADAGAVGCQLLNADGSLQPSGRDSPKICSVWRDLLPLPGAVRHRTRTPAERRDYSETSEVDEVSGAAMLIRRIAADQVGGLDEDFFFLGEDIEFCWRLKKAGWRVYYLASARVIHHWGASRNASNKERISLLSQRASYLLFKKHGKGWEATTVKAILLPISVLKLTKWVILALGNRNLKRLRANLRLFTSEIWWLFRN